MGKRFRRRFKRTTQGFKTAAQIAGKALNTALKVKRLLNVEYKALDTAVTVVNPSNTGSVVPMNAMAQGDADNTRDGNSVLNKSIVFNVNVVEHASASNTQVKLAIIRDMQPNGTTPTWTQIFEENHSLSLQNNLSTRRFKILMSQDYNLSTNGEDNVTKRWYIPVNFHTKYISSLGTAAAIGYNGIYFAYISNQSVNTPTVAYTSRIRYLDN